MSTQVEPRTPLVTDGRIHRVGKIRSGVKKAGSRDGRAVEFPSAVDYWVVNEDSSTSRDAAAAFHEVYGPEPRELDVVLPGSEPEDVLQSAWRMYGAGGLLKRKCGGPATDWCKQRGPDGEWVYGACACKAEGADPTDAKKHCQQRWTLSFLLMRVRGLGIWQFDTGSPIAGDGMASMLALLYNLRGTLMRAPCNLRLVPVQVAPKGRAKTVFIGRLESSGVTPEEALAIAAGTKMGELPPSALDDGPDELLDAHAIDVTPDLPTIDSTPDGRSLYAGPPTAATGAATGDAPAADTPRGWQPMTGTQSDANFPAPPRADRDGTPTVSEQLKAMSLQQRADLYRLAGIPKGSKADVVHGLACAAWGSLELPDFDDSPNLMTLLDALRARETAETRNDPSSAESFQHGIDTGEWVEPGDQTSMYGDGAPS